MPRIACLWVPSMHLAAHVRLQPELANVPLALVEGPESRRVVIATSECADAAGVVVGMNAAQARAVCDSLTIRSVSTEAMVAAAAALVEVASSVSPRTERDGADRVFVDCQGSTALWASESALASALAARALRCDLPAWVGIADSKLAAAVAARYGGGVRIVSAGDDRAFLAPYAVSLLDPDSATASTLASWGIRSIGDLVALPAGAVAHRLGPVGLGLVQRARGDDVPLVAHAVPRTFEEHLALDYVVERLEPLVFVLRRLLDCIARRLELHGLGCRALEVTLDHEGGGRDRRKISVAAPTTDQKTLLTLLRTHLESHLPVRAVTGIGLTADAACIAPTQLDLLRPAGPAPTALAAVLARLTALCGPDRVGVLQAADSHRPDAVRLDRFVGEPSPDGPPGDPLDPRSAPPVVRLALRAFRPPVPLEVFENRAFIDCVRGRGFGGRVVRWAGPWRVRGEWWTAEPYAREYYDVELSDGGVYRIYRDARSGRWSADGVYD